MNIRIKEILTLLFISLVLFGLTFDLIFPFAVVGFKILLYLLSLGFLALGAFATYDYLKKR